MVGEFEYDPVGVFYRTSERIKLFVFVGEVPTTVAKELTKLENGKIPLSARNPTLEKHYGRSWKNRLMLGKTVKGGNGFDDDYEMDEDEDDIDETELEHILEDFDLVDDCGSDDEDDLITGGDEIEEEEETMEDDFADILTLDVDEPAFVETREVEKKEKLHGKEDFAFVFEPIYPVDNIMDVKKKIHAFLGIPVFRQHLYYLYNGRKYQPYSISFGGAQFRVDIDDVLFPKEEDKNTIENIPINMQAYEMKDMLQITALDTFSLISTNAKKFGVNQYYVCDLYDIASIDKIRKIAIGQHQLEIFYYGFVALFFPIITKPIFDQIIANERELSTLFPDLHEPLRSLRERLDLESQILQQAYAGKLSTKNIRSSVTTTTVSVLNSFKIRESLIDLRNVFDKMKLNETIPMCHARFRRNNKEINLRKVFTIKPVGKKNPVVAFDSIQFTVRFDPESQELMYFTLFRNGNYFIKTFWREDRMMSFDGILDIVMEYINPIIKQINKMPGAKYRSVDIPLVEPDVAAFTESSLLIQYVYDFSEARFRVFKEILSEFVKARILSPKEGLDFFLQKGMYNYDPSRLEKSISVQNYYDYFSSGTVRAKWDTLFEKTRSLRFINLSSRMDITVSGIRDMEELKNFDLFLTGLITMHQENTKRMKSDTSEAIQLKSTKRLKNLKFVDPKLYDAKRSGSKIVYSKICQKPYQPLILSDKEYSSLPSKRKKNAVKFKNFTTGKKVWYSCPNAKYPHLKFLVGQHPSGYCIPCCKKTKMDERANPERKKIYDICLRDHEYHEGKKRVTKSHYIASYGKIIEADRISRLPENTLEPLFFDIYSPDPDMSGIDSECTQGDGYYLIGVEQNTPLGKVGMFYVLASAFSMSPVEFLDECVRRLEAGSAALFRMILNGKILENFSTPQDLIKTLAGIDGCSKVENAVETDYNEIFMSIAYYYFETTVMHFEDVGKESIMLHLPENISSVEEMFPVGFKTLPVLELSGNFYPIYLVNSEVWKQTRMVDKKLFRHDSGLSSTVRAVIRNFLGNKVRGMSLPSVKIVAKKAKLEITTHFINQSNLCYGVLLNGIYFPVKESNFEVKDAITRTPISSKFIGSAKSLHKIVGKINSVAETGDEIVPEKWLMMEKMAVGFLFGGLQFYFEPIDLRTLEKFWKTGVEPETILHHPTKINKLIASKETKLGFLPEIKKQRTQGLYEANLYHLFLLHFSSHFSKKKNEKLRKNILDKLKKEKPGVAWKFIEEKIASLDDKAKLKKIIGAYLLDHRKFSVLTADICKTSFAFDMVELEKLKKLKRKELRKELRKIADKFTTDLRKINGEFPNAISACGKDVYCNNGKLMVDKTKIKEIVSIIASEMKNSNTKDWLFDQLYIARNIEFLRFEKRKNEIISVSI
jgi:hypothetical protein